ncbi:MAG: TIGR00730 family Rossman fold protein [Enterobacteriaceae bacterium]|jgi:uncharacterized protein (TIGR00730 family)|nr:TIGR00730 family Rossman fold protein [Enterobacteriaceae bacterium]
MRKNICVYCGASAGTNLAYTEAAQELGKTIAQQGRRLIYGGGNKGLMGVLANAVLDAGGEVTGVIPERLVEAETAHLGLTKLEVVADMHIRKARMSELADGFIALPGGIGTLEELFEVWTWSQIGYHKDPVGLLNIRDFYSPMNTFLQHVVDEGFVRQSYFNTLLVSDNAQDLLEKFDQYQPHNLDRWAK